MSGFRVAVLVAVLAQVTTEAADAQPFGPPDRTAPGDQMIQEYLRTHAARIHSSFDRDTESLAVWEQHRGEYRRQYLHMLGLWPVPKRTPLKATITGTRTGDGYLVDMVHYQSQPGLYVTGNLYRPERVEAGQRLPAVFYVCGHSGRGRNGNKTAYQSHGIWFARHGYVCLVVDTLQLGEIAAIHHGTYREQRWWWHSRGYTSAGVECWNGVRGIDYLVARDDVDPDRIAVTGISGGGAATFWIVAADERVKAAVPVSGMADLPSYVSNRVINGHCDCMFLYNTYQWPWTRIASLIAPRPMLFVNSDQDRIFPMDANERVINRLERLYSLYGAGDSVDSVVSMGGHAYRKDIRKAVYRFINTHLMDDPREVTDSEVDLVGGSRDRRLHPIQPESLRVFPDDSDIPSDELNTTIDEHFVPMASVSVPPKGEFASWKAGLLQQLREVVFRNFPDRIPVGKQVGKANGGFRIETEPGIQVTLRFEAKPAAQAARILVVVTGPAEEIPSWLEGVRRPGDLICLLKVRGIGASRWTSRNPPNYVERSHVLLGLTVDSGRVWDVAAVARYLKIGRGGDVPLEVIGEGRLGMIGAHAALMEPDISGVFLRNPPASYMSADAPQLLNILRVCDVPDVLGMLAPKPLTLSAGVEKVAAIYNAAGSDKVLRIAQH